MPTTLTPDPSGRPWGNAADLIVRNYLERLSALLTGLPRADQEEFLREIRAHIHEAFLDDARGTELERVLRCLDRLGAPERILSGRVGPGLIRAGWLRRLPFYVGAGVLLVVAGLPLGLAGSIALLSAALAVVFIVLVYYAAGVALVATGLLGLITTVFKLAAPGFVLEMSEHWDLRPPHMENLAGRLLFSLLLVAIGGLLLWGGRHGWRGLRFLLQAATGRFRAGREQRALRTWAVVG